MQTRKIILMAVAMLLAVGTAAHGAIYNITPLGTLGGSDSYAYGINASGSVVGHAYTSEGGHRAFLYDGTMHDLGTLGGSNGEATGINDSGQIVGTAETGYPGYPHAFLYDGKMHDLFPISGQTNATGINTSSQVAVNEQSAMGRAYLYDGTLHYLGTLGGFMSRAYGINDSGQVVGSSVTGGQSDAHAFLYDGRMHDLGTLGGRHSCATGINDSGQVVGYAYTSGDAASHAFLYSNGTMLDLGTLSGSSHAYGINDRGQTVGSAYTSAGSEHAFIYDGTMHDLNDLLDPGCGWTITDAQAINDNGWIAANGCNPEVNGGAPQAILLTPVPEPATLSLLALGGLTILRRRSGQVLRRRSGRAVRRRRSGRVLRRRERLAQN